MSVMMRGNIRMAICSVRSAKWRSVLTMMGVIVGIVAVVTVVGIGEGVKRQVAQQLHHFGTDLITIRPGASPASGADGLPAIGTTDVMFGMGGTAGLSTADVTKVERTADVASVAPMGTVSGVVTVGSRHFGTTPVLATNDQLPVLLNHEVAYGEFWQDKDVPEGAQYAAVIGSRVSAKLFDENVPLGRSFTFRGQTFVVRGVLDEFDNIPFSPTATFNDAIFIPYQTAVNLTHADGQLYTILARPDTSAHMATAIQAVTAGLREAHGGQQDFSVLGPGQNIERGGSVVQLLTTWIGAVAAISLFIGGVGIMNIMLLTVTERMHEIGVRKAIGATGRQILGQFLLEATVLSLTGGLIGIVLSLAVDGVLYAYTDLNPVISWQAIVVATVVSVAIGVVFGVAPAIKAARKDPIEALRHE